MCVGAGLTQPPGFGRAKALDRARPLASFEGLSRRRSDSEGTPIELLSGLRATQIASEFPYAQREPETGNAYKTRTRIASISLFLLQ